MAKTLLTEKEATEVGGAISRIAELSGKAIKESTDAAEQRGLEQFVTRVLTEHAGELLGAWFALQYQYRPLVQGFTALIRSALTTIDREQSPPKPEPVKQPENVVPLNP